jgi:hypothetical protein
VNVGLYATDANETRSGVTILTAFNVNTDKLGRRVLTPVEATPKLTARLKVQPASVVLLTASADAFALARGNAGDMGFAQIEFRQWQTGDDFLGVVVPPASLRVADARVSLHTLPISA